MASEELLDPPEGGHQFVTVANFTDRSETTTDWGV